MIPKAGWIMDVKSVWLVIDKSKCTLTHYDCQIRMKNGHGIISTTLLPTCQNAQLTHYDCQRKMKNGHGIISMTIVIIMPECKTYFLLLSKQDEKWTWNYQYHHNQHPARIHNSPPACHEQRHGIISIMTITTYTAECTTHMLWFPEDQQ